VYNLPCVEVIFKVVNQIQTWGDERIKNIVTALAGKQLENNMMISRKIPWTRRWKTPGLGDRIQMRWLSYGLTQKFDSHDTITDYQMIHQMT
jgi:hypothetical protein